MPDKDVQHVTVTVDDAHLATIQSVADALRTAGMHVTNVMPTSGIITGEVSPARVNSLATVTGVAAVEPDQEMHAI